jgi:hypothetical protein
LISILDEIQRIEQKKTGKEHDRYQNMSFAGNWSVRQGSEVNCNQQHLFHRLWSWPPDEPRGCEVPEGTRRTASKKRFMVKDTGKIWSRAK